MGSISSQAPCIHTLHRNPISLRSSSPAIIAFPTYRLPLHRRQFCALKTKPDGGGSGYNSDLLKKSVVVEESDTVEGEEGWVDWEDKMLEDVVPLVGFVRMILHSGKYSNGERFSPEHEKTIIERVLAHHPQCENKIGSGIEYITTGNHPVHEDSRCLFIIRKDGELMDFSYWKCIKGLIKSKYPLYADRFLLKHIRGHRRD